MNVGTKQRCPIKFKLMNALHARGFSNNNGSVELQGLQKGALFQVCEMLPPFLDAHLLFSFSLLGSIGYGMRALLTIGVQINACVAHQKVRETIIRFQHIQTSNLSREFTNKIWKHYCGDKK